MSGCYDANGHKTTTTVAGNAVTGKHAADGSLNVIAAAGHGMYHPCGAIRITVGAPPNGQDMYAPDGSLYSLGPFFRRGF